MAAQTPAPLAADLEDGLKRLKLRAIRTMAPEVLLTAKTQRWAPKELLRTLVEAEVAARDAANLTARRGFRSPRPSRSFNAPPAACRTRRWTTCRPCSESTPPRTWCWSDRPAPASPTCSSPWATPPLQPVTASAEQCCHTLPPRPGPHVVVRNPGLIPMRQRCLRRPRVDRSVKIKEHPSPSLGSGPEQFIEQGDNPISLRGTRRDATPCVRWAQPSVRGLYRRRHSKDINPSRDLQPLNKRHIPAASRGYNSLDGLPPFRGHQPGGDIAVDLSKVKQDVRRTIDR